MRVVFGLQPKCQRGWVSALTTYWSTNGRLLVELGATGTIWRARAGADLKQSTSLYGVYERLHELQSQTVHGASFQLETFSALIGDLFSASVYDNKTFLSDPNKLPIVLAPGSRVAAGQGFVQYGDLLLQIIDKFEKRLAGELEVTVDMGYPLPGLLLQKIWCAHASEITLVLSDDVSALGWLEEFINFEQPITVIIVHADRVVRSHLTQLVQETLGLRHGSNATHIVTIPPFENPLRYRNPLTVKKVSPAIEELYRSIHVEKKVLTDGSDH